MNLKSFGCSFIYGSDLSDDRGTITHPSQLTYPALIAKELGYTYECYAHPGSGNLTVLEQVLNQAASTDNDLFIISWTWLDRFDYYQPGPDTKRRSPWHTIRPTADNAISEMYYKNLHSEYRDKFTNLSYIKLAIDMLKQKNIPFIMTYLDELLLDPRWHISPAVLELQNYIRPHLTTFNNTNFLDWCLQNNYAVTKTLHPFDQAHRAAADYILSLGVHKV